MSGPPEHMRLEVFTPTALLVDVAAAKVVAEGAEGSSPFCLVTSTSLRRCPPACSYMSRLRGRSGF
jgi:hypothetical protein